jgi:hypothetical protein
MRKVQQSLWRDKDDDSFQKRFQVHRDRGELFHASASASARHHTTGCAVFVLIPIGSRPGLGRFVACQFRFSCCLQSPAWPATCYHFDVITSVGNYSRTCGGGAVRSGSSQLSEQVTTFQRVSKKRKICYNTGNKKVIFGTCYFKRKQTHFKFFPSKYLPGVVVQYIPRVLVRSRTYINVSMGDCQ